MINFVMSNFPITFLFVIFGILTNFQVSAQVISDNTLGTENSTVNTNFSGLEINGGATRGSNLFHSFEQFSIPTNGSVLFNNSANIQNIISRVTGDSISDINGLIRANGMANLYLLNPNGITFGVGARINIGGSFFATTTSGLRFADGSIFSANPTQSSNLLTVSTPIGLQLGTKGNITNPDSGNIIVNDLGIENAATLNLQSANNLEINNLNLKPPVSDAFGIVLEADSDKSGQGNIQVIGGEIQSNGGILNLTAAETISLNNTSLKSSSNSTNSAEAMTLKADNISLNNSIIEILTLNSGKSANINIDTTALTIDGKGINNLSIKDGDSGNIKIKTGNLSLINGASISNFAIDKGNLGDINIVVDQDFSLINSQVRSDIAENSTGKAANINIQTNNLSLDNAKVGNQDQSVLPNPTQNQKINGSITIIADSIKANNNSLISTSTFGNGKGGDININTGSLIYENGGGIEADSGGMNQSGTGGNAGNINITGKSISLVGSGPQENQTVGIGSKTYNNGQAGDIKITTDSLSLGNFTGIDANSESRNPNATGESGNIQITANSIKLNDESGIRSNTFNNGNAGNINIQTNILNATGRAGISVGSQSDDLQAKGVAGDINITANNSLSLINGGGIASSTITAGDAGNITIKTGSFIIEGRINRNSDVSLNPGANRNNTVRDGVTANTGIIFSNNKEIPFDNSGNAGNINITADSLSINNSVIASESAGFGRGGKIAINTNTLRLDKVSNISAASKPNNPNTTTPGQAGDIEINAKKVLLLRNNSNISTTAGNQQAPGDGGNIKITTPLLATVPNENTDVTANAFRGQGGKIKIDTQGLFGITVSLRNTPGNDITAFSQTDPSLDGIIAVDISGIDPSQGLVNIPVAVVDASEKIATSCSSDNESDESQFIITGRGGLPPSPNDPLTSDAIWEDTRIFSRAGGKTDREAVRLGKISNNLSNIYSHNSSNNSSVIPSTPSPATGWVFNDKGEVKLISQNHNPHALSSNYAPCPVGKSRGGN
jgi:filamentous hemagglutinin family protein